MEYKGGLFLLIKQNHVHSPKFIQKQFHRFFKWNDAMLVWQELDEALYHRLRVNLLSQPTRREKALNTMLQDPICSLAVLQMKAWNKDIILPPYEYNSSTSHDFKQQFNQW